MGMVKYVALLLLILTACGLRLAPEAEPYPADLEEDIDQLLESLEEPEITEITKEVTEGELVSFPNLAAKDPDNDTITYEFTSPMKNGTWQTKDGDAGTYYVNITATDGKARVTKTVKILVNERNRPPELNVKSPVTVKEGEKVVLSVNATDKEDLTISYSGWMDTSTKETGYQDAGEYSVTVTATDGTNVVSKEIRVIVENVNRPPVFTPGSFE